MPDSYRFNMDANLAIDSLICPFIVILLNVPATVQSALFLLLRFFPQKLRTLFYIPYAAYLQITNACIAQKQRLL